MESSQEEDGNSSNTLQRPLKRYKTHLDNEDTSVFSIRTIRRRKILEEIAVRHRSSPSMNPGIDDDESTDGPSQHIDELGESSQIRKNEHPTGTDPSEITSDESRLHGDCDPGFDSDSGSSNASSRKLSTTDERRSDDRRRTDSLEASSNESKSERCREINDYLGNSSYPKDAESGSDVSVDSLKQFTMSDEEIFDQDDDSCCDDEVPNKEFYEKWIMFDKSNVTVWEVFNMVEAMSLRFQFSEEAQQSVLEFAKLLAGPKFKNLNISKYSMNQIYNVPDEKKAYVFYCPQCSTQLNEPLFKKNISGKNNVTCEECMKEYRLSLSTDNYFLTVDIADQVRTILKITNIQRAINDHMSLTRIRDSDTDLIFDIQSGRRYRECDFIREKNDESHIVITLNINVDGAPLTTTGKKSLWPIQCVINELPPELRFKFFILAAVLVTSTEPKPPLMSLYLRFFIKQINKLMNQGITVQNTQGESTTYFVTIFCFPLDTPARAIVQNRIQFNGYFGCSWCYMKGDYTHGAMRYLLKAEDCAERSQEEFLKDVSTFRKLRQFSKNPEKISKKDLVHFCRLARGSKGPCELTSVRDFDCVWGFPCEYLHAILLGVTKQLWDEWLNPNSYAFLSPSDRNVVDSRLISIQPPNEIHRLPRLLKDRAKWRSSEWRSWLLFYSVPCLNDILPHDALTSYMLLVRVTYTVLCTRITQDDLFQCEIDLIQFVGDCQKLYGKGFMTFNVHSLSHIPESVRRNGPLWATSAFPFESDIGKLKKVVTGPRGVVQQIANSILKANTLKSRISVMPDNNESWQFCKDIFNHRSLVKNYLRTNESVLIEGGSEKNSPFEIMYKRCIYNDVVYHGTAYTRPTKVNNTVVKLWDSTVLEIQFFVAIDQVCHIVGKKWSTSRINYGVQMNHIHVVNEIHETMSIVPITKIKQKLVCVKISKIESSGSDASEACSTSAANVYVCELPNSIEVQ